MAETMQTTPRTGTRRAPARIPMPSLDSVRAEIDELDGTLVRLIARRCRLARQAGRSKAQARLPLVDPAQEAAVVRRGAARARDLGLEEEEVRRIFWHLIGLSRRSQSAAGEPSGPESST